MALERIGLGGVLTIETNQAVQSVGRARDAMGRFTRQTERAPGVLNRLGGSLRRVAQQAGQMARQIGRGVGQIANGLRNAGFAALPLTAGLAAGVNQAANFEQQMSAVSAITNSSEEDMARLTATARTMGIESTFSASQAGQAMEFMGRAGASTEQIIGGLPGVINAAAAEGLDLATATDIVAQSTNIMGREWGQAANTADILVRASQRANTNLVGLNEAMRFGGQSARAAGLDMEETTAIFARLADSGLRGSVGGTALANALNRLASPTAEGSRLLQSMGIEMTRTASGGLDVANIMQQVANQTSQIENPLERGRIATELFGLRGRRAFEALAAAGEESVDSLTEDLRRASDGAGAASTAATRRLDNFRGALTLLMSSLEGVAISLFGPLLEPMKEVLQSITENLNTILQGVNALMAAGDDVEERYTVLNGLFEEQGDTMTNVILGITDAISDVQAAFAWVRDTINEVGQALGGSMGGDAARMFTRFAVLAGIAAAALAPILIGIGGIAFIVTTVLIPIIEGVGAILGAISLPVVVAVGVIIGAFLLIRREGESFGQTMSRIFGVIRVAALRIWVNALQPLWRGITSVLGPAIETLGEIWSEIVTEVRGIINELAVEFSGATGDMTVDFEEVGRVIGAVIATAAEVFLRFVRFIVPTIGFITRAMFRMGRAAINNVVQPLRTIVRATGTVWRGFQLLFDGNILDGLMEIRNGLFDLLLEPLRAVTRQIIALADAVGGADIVPQGVRDFANAVENPNATIRRGRQRGTNDLFAALLGDGDVPDAPSLGDEPSAARQELDQLGAQVTQRQAGLRRRRGAGTTVEANLELTDERELNVESRLCVDGSEMATATARHQQEVGERAGFRTTPWQRRIRVEQGAAPVTGGG